MKIKFCGVRRSEDVAAINLLQPDYMGMILSAGFRRSVPLETAAQLVQQKADSILSVGVFVNETTETMLRIAAQLHLDVLQLHGAESPEQIRQLQQASDCRIWKALRIDSLAALEAAAQHPADCLVLEGNTGNAVGGTGICADWSLLAKRTWNRPFFLAGGLKPENVKEAIATVQPDGVDFSSGIETDGVKSFDKMKQIITTIRGAENNG
jgi:phosphoribosylanthranilate isomerase